MIAIHHEELAVVKHEQEQGRKSVCRAVDGIALFISLSVSLSGDASFSSSSALVSLFLVAAVSGFW